MRVLLVSDIHGNADALRAVLEHARGWDDVWVLGDLVDYGPEPHAVVDMVRELDPGVAVMGNHDNAVAYGVDCMCDPAIHELSVYTRQRISLRLLDEGQRRWLRSLPHRARREEDGHRFYIVHGSPRSPLYGYLRPSLPEERLREHLSLPGGRLSPSKGRLVDADTVVVGHTHLAFAENLLGRLVVNPGSVGQPRDGDLRASYAILDTETLRVGHHRVHYQVDRVVEKLRALGLEQRYLRWLEAILRQGQATPPPGSS